jgi:flagellar basal-body rod protein FlgC
MMFNAIDVSTSGLVAQRVRSNTIAMNIAMADAVDSPDGGPYQRRSVIFEAGRDARDGSSRGVHVAKIEKEPVYRWEYDPGHPYANKDGYVKLPGIDPMVEMVNLIEASRAYEANVTAIDVSKAMLNSSLRLLA